MDLPVDWSTSSSFRYDVETYLARPVGEPYTDDPPIWFAVELWEEAVTKWLLANDPAAAAEGADAYCAKRQLHLPQGYTDDAQDSRPPEQAPAPQQSSYQLASQDRLMEMIGELVAANVEMAANMNEVMKGVVVSNENTFRFIERMAQRPE